MAITHSEDDRKLGVVWHDPARDQSPSTHVMIVGVGQFTAPGLKALKSTPASARALADWFLEGARKQAANGFTNAARPLGSLALLLSENDNGTPSIFEEAAVPRATFNCVKDALRAWVVRAATDDASVAILAFFSHGQAERRRTAVLFEDYGSDDLDPYAGMTEVEQLVDSLATLAPRDKLVIFDCCRMQVDLQLPHQGDFGSPLIGGRAGAIPVRPQVMMSTQYDGAGFGGQAGRPTLFASALLHGLRGCAADSDDLTVNTRRLGEITEKILGLWRKDDEPIQVPDTQLGRSFVLTKVPNIDQTLIFVSIEEPYDIKTAKIEVYEEENKVYENTDVPGTDPFLQIALPSDRIHRFVARDEMGKLIGENARRSRPPVGFRKLPDDGTYQSIRTEQTKSVDGDAFPAVELKVNSGKADRHFVTIDSQLITINRVSLDGPLLAEGSSEILFAPGILEQQAKRLSPGDWLVNVSRPGLPQITRSVQIKDGDTVRIDVPNPKSPHEWLANAVAAGVVRPSTRHGSDNEGAPKGLEALVNDKTAKLASLKKTTQYVLYKAKDEHARRFEPNIADQIAEPFWIEFQGRDPSGRPWRERAFVPLAGYEASFMEQDPWIVEVLVDNDPPPRGSHLSAYPVSGKWGPPLIAFLGRRHFDDAGAMLRLLGGNALLMAVYRKEDNPLAAICAALVAVATHQTESLGIPEQWLENLCNWFPTLPDGAIILARHRLHSGRDAGDLLEKALNRGVPVTSLAVDWLAEALAMVGHPQAAAARDTAMACDPTKAFTVLQIPVEAP